MTSLLKIDQTVAQNFLRMVCGDTISTIQTFSDKDKLKKSNNLGIKYDPKAKIFHGWTNKIINDLNRLQAIGAGVFLMVNQGDNKGRQKENVTGTRAVFVDLDGAPLDPVIAADLQPHIIVESSPERFHAYWLTESYPLEMFTPVQKALAARFSGDRRVHDLPRVMRLPGTWHLKTDHPYKVRIVTVNDNPRYHVQDVIDALGLDLSSEQKEKRSRRSTVVDIDGKSFEVVDKSTGELFDLEKWAKGHPDFLIANALEEHAPEVVCGTHRDNKHHIRCPFHHEHTNPDDDNATFCVNGNAAKNDGFVVMCMHDHCADRDRLDFVKEMLSLGWLPLEALTDRRFLAERTRPKWIKYAIDDLIRDPLFSSLSPDEKCKFVYCQHYSWTYGDGTFPDNPSVMTRHLGISDEKWLAYRDYIVSLGLVKTEGDRLIHRSTLESFETSRRDCEKAVRAGRIGGKSRGSASSCS